MRGMQYMNMYYTWRILVIYCNILYILFISNIVDWTNMCQQQITHILLNSNIVISSESNITRFVINV